MNIRSLTVGIILEGKKRELILQKRSRIDSIILPGKTCVFGGGIKKNETPKEAIVREMLEELSLHLKPSEIMMWRVYRQPRGPGRLKYVFLARNINRAALKLHEGESIIYLSGKDSLDDYDLGPITRELLEEYRRKIIY